MACAAWSSVMMNTMFGRCAGAGWAERTRARRPSTATARAMSRVLIVGIFESDGHGVVVAGAGAPFSAAACSSSHSLSGAK